ncbi:hypothetical protein FRC07_002645 [Ceratobasidium sp. 392]|nr:hypothetical protein FRC07_002645 [Ceratobasidium sp. 392]
MIVVDMNVAARTGWRKVLSDLSGMTRRLNRDEAPFYSLVFDVLTMDTKFYIHPMPGTSTTDASDIPTEPVDFILAMLASLLITAAAFPLGIVAALLHVLGTVIRNIPTCAVLAVGCVVLTSAVLIASVAYALFWLGMGLIKLAKECKRLAEEGASFGTNMASLFADEFRREKRKQLYERWGIRA